MKEVWKDIKGYEGYYKISNKGKVKSLKRKGNWKERILKPQKDMYGYLRVNLTKNGKAKPKAIHRLLAESFIPNPKELPTVDQINRNKLDNRIENLRWASYSLQNSNKIAGRSIQNLKSYSLRGRKNPKSKAVIQYDLNHDYINKFSGIREAERITGIASINISRCCNNKAKRAGGFIWKFA